MNAAERFVRPSGTYLLSHSVGLPLAAARTEAVADHFDVWEHDPAASWPTWLASIDAFRSELAALLSGATASFCPQTNVSSGLTKILDALPPPRGGPKHGGASPRRSTLLLTEEAFPSLGYVAAHADYDVQFIPSHEPAHDPDVWARYLSAGVDVALITHVHSNTGRLIPAEDIIDVARSHGTVTVVDVAQSAGVVPIDLEVWAADFVIGSCVKWLCGGPGAGWMWVAPHMIERCEPNDVGWFSHADPFEFDIHDFRYAPDALRFWGGTPSVLPTTVARRSIAALREIGVDVIRDHNTLLSDRLVAGLGGSVVSPIDAAQRSGTVVVAAGDSTDDVLAALTTAGVAVDRRATGIRMSPHIYNSLDDVDAVIELVTKSIDRSQRPIRPVS